MALVAIWPAVRLLRRSEIGPHRIEPRDILVPISVLAMMFSVTATNCSWVEVVDGFVVTPAAVYARLEKPSYGERTGLRWAKSVDGGMTWTPAPRPDGHVLARYQACQGSDCFRVSPDDARVEERAGSRAWRTSFRFTDEQIKRMKLREATGCIAAVDPRAIVALNGPTGTDVIVTMGAHGVLHRSPDGTWERLSVLGLEPIPLYGPRWLWYLEWSPAALALAGVTLALLGRRRTWLLNHGLGFGLGGGFVLLILPTMMTSFGIDYTRAGPVTLCLTIAMIALMFVTARRQLRRRSLPPPRPDSPPSTASVH